MNAKNPKSRESSVLFLTMSGRRPITLSASESAFSVVVCASLSFLICRVRADSSSGVGLSLFSEEVCDRRAPEPRDGCEADEKDPIYCRVRVEVF